MDSKDSLQSKIEKIHNIVVAQNLTGKEKLLLIFLVLNSSEEENVSIFSSHLEIARILQFKTSEFMLVLRSLESNSFLFHEKRHDYVSYYLPDRLMLFDYQLQPQWFDPLTGDYISNINGSG